MQQVNNHSRKVLIVEDDAIVSLELMEKVRKFGYNAIGPARTGEEAIRIALTEEPDIILMDIILEGQITGIEAVNVIRETRDIPVIYVTASSDRETVEKAKSTTPFGYLVKPIDEKELVITIEMTLKRREFEKRLAESESKFRNLFEDSRDAIYIWKKDSGYVDFNNSMLELFGYNRDEMPGLGIHDFFPDTDNLKKYVKSLKEQGFVKDMHLKLKKKDGSVMVCIASASVLKNDKGKFNGIQGIIRDISDIQDGIDRLNSAMGGIVRAMSLTVEARDPYTAGHQRKVADISIAIAGLMKLSPEQTKGLEMAALIHDLGKINVPYEILNKPGRLTSTEFEIIKSHPKIGYDIMKTIEFPWPLAKAVYQHHERIDGSGYPEGVRGDDIILEARILAVSDVVEAMASHRPYRPAIGLSVALEEIEGRRGTLYDAGVVDACLVLFREKNFIINENWM
ncbi:MAG TPA: response regulator [Spirochaetota bacterium]|nr:response regulator [Spirochaetota bacterium]HQP49355.1 response regulator [Spirochaetota bacterium]